MNKVTFGKSKALIKFKDLIGQNNHFLITILIGLDGVAKREVTLGEDFSTSWNPRDIDSSVTRSRHFAIKATLSWIVDSIDAYFIMSNRTPKLIQDSQFIESMDKAGQRVAMKLDAFRANVKCLDVEYALVKLAITWRNRLVHNFADNELPEDARGILSNPNNEEYIKERYRGLNIKTVLQSFDASSKSVPKFKEITALVSASINFITDIDEKLVGTIDQNIYADEIVNHYIMVDANSGSYSDKKERLRKVESIWAKDRETKIKKIKNIFAQYGCIFLDTDLIVTNLSNLTVKGARQKFNLVD
ncbi:hypothetical protein [Bacillus wiedmannii]|uniref:hypothetical protein n=1 Tax=Bacillus wiedmannii TaxID=1890302 RepID=UPI0008640630|nr:hypothetical protein [Bacillus wiedmannii]SCN02041.1 Uncharacterized protein BCINRASA_01218 [Bacillus wiedmannii]